MRGITHLLLLAALVHLARCQLQVSMLPKLQQIFSGDLFFLKCDKSGKSESKVTWYIDDTKQSSDNHTLKIGAAAPTHSGSYQCESNGEKSDKFNIKVLNYIPSASLIIKTGQPVVRKGDSVVLQLDNDDGLKGWRCLVYREGHTNNITLRVRNNSVSVAFQPTRLKIPETIFWCIDTEQRRSNQIIVRTSEKALSLEMYPLPAVVGKTLTLKCLAWGTDRISQTIFYKDNKTIWKSSEPTHKVTHVTLSAKGTYKCRATFTYMRNPAGPPHEMDSDNQYVFVQELPISAVLSVNIGLWCSCPECPNEGSFHWYYKNGGQNWVLTAYRQVSFMPKASGTYACRAVWNNGRSLLSNVHVYYPPVTFILISVIIVLGILCSVAGVIYMCYRKRNTTEQVYEDVPLRSKDDKYETLQKGARKEGEYDTLNPEAPGRQKKEGEYEPLKKDEMSGGEYQTVRLEGAVGGEGGYEALKKEGMTGGEYHTVRIEGAVGGEGGYEALKKEGMTGGEYQTVRMEGAGGGEGGYEALKKEGMTGGEYQTVRMEGAGGGEGGYEALKKKEMAGGEYHTLKIKGAGGGEGGYEALKKKEMAGGEYHTLKIKGAGGGE